MKHIFKKVRAIRGSLLNPSWLLLYTGIGQSVYYVLVPLHRCIDKRIGPCYDGAA